VATIKAQVAAAQTDVASIKQQLQTVQQGVNQIQVSLAGIEPIIQRVQTVLTIGTSPAATQPTGSATPPRR